MFKDFKEFLMRGNVVDLAVAVVIGAAFGAVVKSLVDDLLMPLIAALFGEPDFSHLVFTINGSIFTYGSFITAVITFLLIAAAVYFVVVRPMAALDARRREKEEEAPSNRECPYCLSEVPVAATKCAYCTSALTPA